MVRRLATTRLLIGAALALLVGVGATPPGLATEPRALEVLEGIAVEDEHSPGYDRIEQYAPSSWTDTTGNGCSTREDVLARDLEATRIGADGCTVEYGEAVDAYTGERIAHVQGDSTVEIDHVVAVEEADRSGAHAFNEEMRQAFYQDPENLVAIGGAENSAKGSDDPADYMPPNEGVHCAYVGAVVYIKDKYKLTMDAAEHASIRAVLTEPACEATRSAPAQAMYTEDWDEADRTFFDLVAAHPLASAIIGLAALLIVLILCGSPRARRWVFRRGSRSVRRGIRRAARSAVRR